MSLPSRMESTEIRTDELKIEKQKLPPLNSTEKTDCNKQQQKQSFKDFGTIIKVLPCHWSPRREERGWD